MTIPPVVAQYTGTGTTEKHGDLDSEYWLLVSDSTLLLLSLAVLAVYVTGSGTKGVVFIPDIFGVTPQAVQVRPAQGWLPGVPCLGVGISPTTLVCALPMQVADKLAGAGFLVGFPDPFRGKPWPMDKFPPPNRDELMDWIHGFSYDGHVKPDIDATVAALRAKGATSFGIVGFCWGGKMSTLAVCASSFLMNRAARPSVHSPLRSPLVSVLSLPTRRDPFTHPPTHPSARRKVRPSRRRPRRTRAS